MTALTRQLQEIAEACGGAVKESARQWSSRCPAHADTSPSLRIAAGDDGKPMLTCLVGCEYAEVRAALVSLHVAQDVLRPAAKAKVLGGPVRRPRVAQQADAKPLPSAATVAKWHDALRTQQGSSDLLYLTRERGLYVSTLVPYEVGRVYNRLVIPIRDADGSVVNLRKYDRTARKNKMANHTGHGAARLFPLDVLAGDGTDEPVLLCEGEWDALLAGQHGFTAITGTGGAGSSPADLEALRGRSVYIAYDCDEAGSRGARAIGALLLRVAKEVFIVDLGLGSNGEDLTDWFLQGRSEEALSALMDAAEPLRADPVRQADVRHLR